MRSADQLEVRSLTTRPTPKRAAKPLGVTGVHKLLHNPYYKGEVSYQGVHYPGAHEPLIDPATWMRVQDALTANSQVRSRRRSTQHYLRGSVFCGDCGSRLMMAVAKNRHGSKYPYMVCSGRAPERNDCLRRAMRVETIEAIIEREYRTVALAPALRDEVEASILDDFDRMHADTEAARKALAAQEEALKQKQRKLLEAHYAGAIPLDLMKAEQGE